MKIYEVAIKISEHEYEDIVLWIKTPHKISLMPNCEPCIKYIKEVDMNVLCGGVDITIE